MTVRCAWVSLNDPLYLKYHDEEWGVPVHDDRRLFEFLLLEGFQAGLSWRTILYKRENFRRAFDDFDPIKIAAYDEEEISDLLNDAGIIRNKLKVRAAITNAQAYLDVVAQFGSFNTYLWDLIGGKSIVNTWRSMQDIPARTPLSDAISKDLISRGFRFVGSTIIYAHMQAIGMVNDHTVDCFRYHELTGGSMASP